LELPNQQYSGDSGFGPVRAKVGALFIILFLGFLVGWQPSQDEKSNFKVDMGLGLSLEAATAHR
jgi:hypothetical protein